MMDRFRWELGKLAATALAMLFGMSTMFLFGCAQPVTTSAPTDSLCVATGELHFSEPVLAAMNRADVEAFDHFNETWDAHCGATK